MPNCLKYSNYVLLQTLNLSFSQRFYMMSRLAKRSMCSTYNYNAVPDCIWMEILCRMPSKSVFRFKSVSKQWLTLISHPSFVCHYKSFSTNNTNSWTLVSETVSTEDWLKLGFGNEIKATSDYRNLYHSKLNFYSSDWQLDENDDTCPIRIEAISNGLLLLGCAPSFVNDHYGHYNYKEDHYAIFNPITRQQVFLPHIRIFYGDVRFDSMVGFVTHLSSIYIFFIFLIIFNI